MSSPTEPEAVAARPAPADTPPSRARAVLKRRRAKPFFAHHPWVFSGALAGVEGEPTDGDLVDLVTADGRFVGRGFYNSRSQIRVRLVSWNPDEPIDREFWRRRVAQAVRFRTRVLGLGDPQGACRLVYSDSDGLPGLVVDRYASHLVVQWTSLGMARLADLLVPLLAEATGCRGIYQRTERDIGRHEGLALDCRMLWGEEPPAAIQVRHGPIRYAVDVRHGQKTGLYLDQRPNHPAVGRWCAGRRVLDAFAYGGAFGLWAAWHGAREVISLDVSEAAVAAIRHHAELNRLPQVQARQADVFEYLTQAGPGGERFDAIILDPPKFARTSHTVEAAIRAYRTLVSGALKLLTPDAILVVCACSQHIGTADLGDAINQVAVEAGRSVQVLAVTGQSPDHPIVSSCPQTAYLRVIVCHVA